ncbi:acyl carrier protein [Streptomyces galbus]|uniref:acyl carrier protein n=1 Tax=Streptomyces galbus TaxID=33898 RepID=UPI003EB9AC47
MLADHFHGPGTHLRLGARLDLPLHPLPDGLPTADPTLDARLTADAPLVGLRPVGRRRLAAAALLAQAARRPGVHYVVADSYHLPWLPYYGNAHMDHSFLLTAGPAGWHITDAYRIETRWGAAEPGEHVGDEQALRGIGTAELVTFAPAPLEPAEPSVADFDPEPYVTAYATWPDRLRALEQLSAETWLLARARKLHAAYRARCAGRPGPTEAERAHLAAWDKLVKQTYLAQRRVALGRPEPAGAADRLAELLAADHAVFTADALAASGAGDELRSAVARMVADVLGVPQAELLDGTPLDYFPSFTSFRLIEIIDRIESDLGLELDADELIPEKLRRVDDFCRIVRR